MTLSNIYEICISRFGARLTLGKYRFPLQRDTENYRITFNKYIASTIYAITARGVYKGKVKIFSDQYFADCFIGKWRKGTIYTYNCRPPTMIEKEPG